MDKRLQVVLLLSSYLLLSFLAFRSPPYLPSSLLVPSFSLWLASPLLLILCLHSVRTTIRPLFLISLARCIAGIACSGERTGTPIREWITGSLVRLYAHRVDETGSLVLLRF